MKSTVLDPEKDTSPLSGSKKCADIPMTENPVNSTGLSLRRSFSWSLVGNIVYAGCQWGMLVVLTKLTSPEMVGRFALGLAVTGPIIMLSQFQLRGIQATDTIGEYEFGHYLGLRLSTTALALLIITGVVIVGNYSLETALVIIAVGLSKAFESISDVYYGLMQRHERMDRITRSRILKGLHSLVVMGSMVFLTGEVLWGVVGLAAVWGLFLFTYDLKNAAMTLKESNTAPNKEMSRHNPMLPIFEMNSLLCLSRLALPLGIVMALLSLNANIPRYFIESYWGESELGIFAALAYLVITGNVIVSAMGQSVTPRLAQHYASGEINKYQQLLLRMIGIGVFLGAGGMLAALVAGQPVLAFLYSAEYADRAPVFIWLMLAGGLSYVASFLGYGLTAARYFKRQVPIIIAATGGIYVASLAFIPNRGIAGAAYTLSIGSGIVLVLYAFVIKYAINQKQMVRIN